MKNSITIFTLLAITAPSIAMQKNKNGMRKYKLEIECWWWTNPGSGGNLKASAQTKIGESFFTLFKYHENREHYVCPKEHSDKKGIKEVLENALSKFYQTMYRNKKYFYKLTITEKTKPTGQKKHQDNKTE